MKRKVPVTKPWFPEEMQKKILGDINEIMNSGQLMFGKYSKLLEESYCNISNSKYGVSVTSASTGLQIALKFCDVAGAEVLVPSASFITDVSTIQMESASPILVDINPETLSFDMNDLKNKVTKKTKAIIWVHLAGYIGEEYEQIIEFAKNHNLFLIEDASHAHGAEINGKKAGSLGDVGIFSFYPTKVVTAGTGGILTTNNQDLNIFAKDVRIFGTNQVTGEVDSQGSDWFLDEFRCSIGYRQTCFLNENLKRRRKIADIYEKGIKKLKKFRTLNVKENHFPSFYQYPIFSNSSNDASSIRSKLIKEGVECKTIYKPIHKEILFKNLSQAGLSQSERVLEESICLPIFVNMNDEQVNFVIQKLFEISLV